MSTKQKILLRIAIMMIVAVAISIAVVIINFRHYGIDVAKEKATIVSELVKQGLTSHMVNGTMDKRQLFLDNIMSLKDVRSLRVLRGDLVTKQYGAPVSQENARDTLDREVLATGKIAQHLVENSDTALLRVTIPYTATSTERIKCLTCHQAKEGDVLGAITMEFDIANDRRHGIATIIDILVIMIVALLGIIFVTNRLLNPYLDIFEHLKASIKEATHGNFTQKVTTALTDEAGSVATWYNSLLDKLNDTFGSVQRKLGVFVANTNPSLDPLANASYTIEELSHIYKFKKTIELDEVEEDIFERIGHILQERFGCHDFTIFSVNDQGHKLKPLYQKGRAVCAIGDVIDEQHACRCYRTGHAIDSLDFPHLCPYTQHDARYLCLPISFSGSVRLIAAFATTQDNHDALKHALPHIQNYLDEAGPILETKWLMKQLKDSSLHDGLTGLYNRKFLDEYIVKASSLALREDRLMGLLMVDVDFFKMVNDTYGHDVGDTVIKEIASTLTHTVRESDLVIRYGGEEIIVVVHGVHNETDLIALAEKIRQKVEALIIETPQGSLKKTVSIGASLFPQDSDGVWKCIKFADVALYHAKTHGRNRVSRFELSMWDGEQF